MKFHRFQSSPLPGGTASRMLRPAHGRLKLASMPFEVIQAMSRDPRVLRECFRLGLGAWLAAAGITMATAQTNTNATVVAPVAPASPAVVFKAESNAVPSLAGTNAVPVKVAVKPAPAPAAPAAATNAPPGSYEAYRIVADRNIFNPSRTARTARSRGGETEAPKPPPKIESFALVGTMSYEKGWIAFFDSSTSAYRKSAKVGDAIAGYTLKEIDWNHVKLESDGKALELKVNTQLRREDDGPWQPTARSGEFSAASSSSASASDSSLPSSDNGGASELLRRLMEKRQKELSK